MLDNLNVHLAPELAAFGCLAATGLTIEPGNHMHYAFKLVS